MGVGEFQRHTYQLGSLNEGVAIVIGAGEEHHVSRDLTSILEEDDVTKLDVLALDCGQGFPFLDDLILGAV